MAISKKNTAIIIAVIASFIIFTIFYATRENYSEDWIIGKSRNEIEDRYGKFDLNFERIVAYELPEDHLDSVWTYYMGGDPVKYYYIRFDENGLAKEVYIGSYPGG